MFLSLNSAIAFVKVRTVQIESVRFWVSSSTLLHVFILFFKKSFKCFHIVLKMTFRKPFSMANYKHKKDCKMLILFVISHGWWHYMPFFSLAKKHYFGNRRVFQNLNLNAYKVWNINTVHFYSNMLNVSYLLISLSLNRTFLISYLLGWMKTKHSLSRPFS